MADLSPLLMSLTGAGSVTALVAAGRWVTDVRAQRRAERGAEARAPLQQKSRELRIAEQAGEILQQTIDNLRRDNSELQGRFDRYRRDTDEQRQRDMQEADRLREHDRQELETARQQMRGLQEQIHDLNAQIVRMEFELQRYRSAASGQ